MELLEVFILLCFENSGIAVVIRTPQVIVLLPSVIQQLILPCEALDVCLARLHRTYVVGCCLVNSRNMSTKVALFAGRIGVCALGIGADKRTDVNIEDVSLERTWGFEGCS